jgi:Tfp pilus assembly protein PilZ
MEEKRKFIRIEKTLVVKYSSEINNRGNWDLTSVKNISEEGMMLDTSKQFQVGENILLMFKIPLDPFNWIETKGSVIESIPYTGKTFLTRLKFSGISEAQKRLIKDYISWFLGNKAPDGSMSLQNEKRKSERIYKNLMLSYGIQNHLGVVEKWDIATVRNFSRTGMVFTSSYACVDKVDFMIKLPSHPYDLLRIRGKVIESSALKLPNLETVSGTFLTRVEFIDLKDEENKLLCDYIEWLIKNDPDRPKKEDAQ